MMPFSDNVDIWQRLNVIHWHYSKTYTPGPPLTSSFPLAALPLGALAETALEVRMPTRHSAGRLSYSRAGYSSCALNYRAVRRLRLAALRLQPARNAGRGGSHHDVLQIPTLRDVVPLQLVIQTSPMVSCLELSSLLTVCRATKS